MNLSQNKEYDMAQLDIEHEENYSNESQSRESFLHHDNQGKSEDQNIKNFENITVYLKR